MLQHHVSFNNKNDLEVYYVAWPVDYDPLEPYSSILNRLSGRTSESDWLDVNGLLIIDEAQASYKSGIWNNLIKFIEPGFGLRIALFSSYGSASTLVSDASTSTPLRVEPDQRVSLRRSSTQRHISLMLSRPECDDLIARRSEAYGYPDSFLLSADLVDLIFYTTQGHASAVTCILNILSDAEVSVFG